MDVISMYPEYLRQFNRDDYRAAFEKYKTENLSFFVSLCDESIGNEVAAIMDFAANELKRKIGRKPKCFDLRSFLCVYLCPAALDFGTAASEKFALALAESWSSEYHEFQFEAGGFEDIASGFRTKPFSF